jgi:uncharacterized delta-60 repeat protein
MAALGATLVVGCGDDEDGTTDGDAGEAGSAGTSGKNTGGSGGKNSGGTAGKNTGGSTAGSTNDGGMGNTSMGGEGGSGAAPIDGGAGGEGGSPVEVPPAPINPLSDVLYTQASDLRGLFYTDDDKLYASGHIGASTAVDKQIVVARFDSDGEPDATFGGDGFIELNLVERTVDTVPEIDVVTNDGNEESIGIVELESGELMVQVNVRDANGKGMDVGLLKLDSAGVPVPGFGTDGLKRLVLGWDPADDAAWAAVPGVPATPGAPSDTAWGLELDNSTATEKVVVFAFGSAAKGSTAGMPAVQRLDNDRYVLRLLASDGSLDPDFNAGKVFTYHTGGTNGDNGRRGVVNADGSILSGGYTNLGEKPGNHIMAIKLTPAGVPDMAFGFGWPDKGVASSNPFVDDGGAAECYSLTVQSNGRIVSTGYGRATKAGVASSYPGYVTTDGVDMISVALTANGDSVDTTFGVEGTRVIQSEEAALASSEDRGRDILALADDRLVYAGRYGTDPALFVVEKDGSYDPDQDVGYLFRFDPLGHAGNPTAEPPVPAVPTSHFYRVVQSTDGKRIFATTNNHADGVVLAVLKVGE